MLGDDKDLLGPQDHRKIREELRRFVLMQIPQILMHLSIIMADMVASSTGRAESCPSSTSDSEDCSSVTSDKSSNLIPWTDDTFSARMKRVCDWRDGVVKAPSEPRTHSLKRKLNPHQTDDDAVSRISKRPCLRGGHPWPAYDTLFPSSASLRKHSRVSDTPEACRVAVEYNFE